MIIGFLSDAHGNPDWFDAVYEALVERGAERFFFLGDAVGYLPWPNAVIDRLMERSIPSLAGNHEQMVLDPARVDPAKRSTYRLDTTLGALGAGHIEHIRGLPSSATVSFGGRRLLMVHGSPRAPRDGYVYPDTEIGYMADLPFDAVFMGHTHRPFIRGAGPVLAVNVGSCGLPRDVGCLPSGAVYNTDDGTAELVRCEMDAATLLSAVERECTVSPSIVAVLRRRAGGKRGEA